MSTSGGKAEKEYGRLAVNQYCVMPSCLGTLLDNVLVKGLILLYFCLYSYALRFLGISMFQYFISI